MFAKKSYDEDALSGIIDEVADDLDRVEAKLSSHCEDFENGVGDEEEDDEEAEEDDAEADEDDEEADDDDL
ncbi:hypothetical protein FOCC_FOCC007161 [Frankliniella occidentalis]|nr:hypothetical protein FOCC_FOCC007161 [Frankliniella occidentalis]